MTLTQEQRQAAQPLWDAQLDEPFVQGIATGTLPVERFANWLLQDYCYLKHFSRVFAYAAAKADRLESMQRYAQLLDLTLNTEMDLHRRYAARFDISPQRLDAAKPWPTTHAYTDFLVTTARDGDLAELLAALLPCSWGYAHVAQKMAQQAIPQDDRYADWIAQYTDHAYLEATRWLIGEMDRLGEATRNHQRQHLIDLFVRSSQFELDFWRMCWNGPASRATK